MEQIVRLLSIFTKKKLSCPLPHVAGLEKTTMLHSDTQTGSQRYWRQDQSLTWGRKACREVSCANASLSGRSLLKSCSALAPCPPPRLPQASGYPGTGEREWKMSLKGKSDRKHRVLHNRKGSKFHSKASSKQP